MCRIHRGLLAVALAAGGCAATAPEPADVRAGQERACAIVVAEHVGMPVEAVTPAWDHATAEGTAVVRVEAPRRPHTCEVDGALRVLALEHPRE